MINQIKETITEEGQLNNKQEKLKMEGRTERDRCVQDKVEG
jgi:hypothetical protein